MKGAFRPPDNFNREQIEEVLQFLTSFAELTDDFAVQSTLILVMSPAASPDYMEGWEKGIHTVADVLRDVVAKAHAEFVEDD